MSHEHTIALADGWSLWRRFVVRGAGFADATVLKLALPDATRQVDVLLDLENQVDVARAEIVAALTTGEWSSDGQLAISGRDALKKRILTGQPVDFAGLPPPIASALSTLQDLADRLAAHRSEAQRGFASEQQRVRAEIRSMAGENRFREAVLWQNPTAVVNGLDAILRSPIGSTSWKVRRYQGLAANYLQRYCTKTDTIGFFGPVGWGSFVEAGESAALRPGADLLSRRRVYFEYWAIDALAQSIAERPGIKPWLVPRRVPTACFAGDSARLAGGRTVDFSTVAAQLVRECDGERSARDLAQLGLASADEVYRQLAELTEQGVLYWTLEIPIGDQYPERGLRRLLEGIGDDSLRLPALATLEELEQKRDAVARAAGDATALARALDDANETFTRLTGEASARHGGRTYGARTTLYEDCIRDVDFTLGPEVWKELQAPLALVLASGRWFTHGIVAAFAKMFGEVHAALRAELHSDEVDFLRFWDRVTPYLAGGSAVQTGMRSSIGQEVEAELQSRWATVLELSPEPGRRDYSSASLRSLVHATFDAPHSGAALLREHSPDLSIAAESVAAIARGEYFFVLSELHTGANTFAKPPFIDQCPFADELVAAMARDIPEAEVFPVPAKEMNRRISPVTYKENDVHFETAQARSWLPRDRVLAVSELFVKSLNGTLVVGNRRDQRRFDIVDFLQSAIVRSTIQSFSIAPAWRHTPRITIDKLVIARETWRFGTDEIPFLGAEDDFQRFALARRWARKFALPRFVFFKTPAERKPAWIDLESSIYIDLFCRTARKSPSVVLTEMLPAIGQSWLADREGNRYVSELRCCAVDPKVPSRV